MSTETKTRVVNPVTRIAAAESRAAAAHFARRFEFETDCADVHSTAALDPRGFALLDVRSPEAFARGHVPGAINLPVRQIEAASLDGYADDSLFVVYCAGPHCNAAHQAALRIAQLGRPVKEMLGGITGWVDEGLQLESA